MSMEHLLCTWSCAEHFLYIISLNPHVSLETVMFLSYKWEPEAQREAVTAQVTQPAGGEQGPGLSDCTPQLRGEDITVAPRGGLLTIGGNYKRTGMKQLLPSVAVRHLGSTGNTVAILLLFPELLLLARLRYPPPSSLPHPALWGTDRTQDLESHPQSPHPSCLPAVALGKSPRPLGCRFPSPLWPFTGQRRSWAKDNPRELGASGQS